MDEILINSTVFLRAFLLAPVHHCSQLQRGNVVYMLVHRFKQGYYAFYKNISVTFPRLIVKVLHKF